MTRMSAFSVILAISSVVSIASLHEFAYAQDSEAAPRARPVDRVQVDDVPTIFDVRKSLPMSADEPTYHDFYINAGSEEGFKKGQYLPIQRAIPVHDPIQNKQQAIMTIPIGKVLVIHVDRDLTVARLVQELSGDERPTVEYEAIMIGDRVDMKGISTTPPKDNGKRRGTKPANSPASEGPTVTAEAEVVTEPASQTVTPSTAQSAPTVQTLPATAIPAPQPVKTDSAAQPNPPQRVTQPVPPPTA